AWALKVCRLQTGMKRTEPGEDLLALGLALGIAQLGLALEPRGDLVEQPEDMGVSHDGDVRLLPEWWRGREGRGRAHLECGRPRATRTARVGYDEAVPVILGASAREEH